MSAGEIDILLVEDSSTDVDLTLHVLRQSTLANRTYVARDGEEALEYLFGRGAYSDRGPECPVKLILLDLKLPKVDGLTVPEAARRTGRNPETIRRWIRQGKLPSRRVGTQHLIDPAEIARVLDPGADMLGLPASWRRTRSGAPMPNVVAAVRASRVGH